MTIQDILNFLTTFPNPQIQNQFGGGRDETREELLKLAEQIREREEKERMAKAPAAR